MLACHCSTEVKKQEEEGVLDETLFFLILVDDRYSVMINASCTSSVCDKDIGINYLA